MYQLLVSGGVVGLFLQVVPITCLVGVIYAVYRCIRIKKQKISVKWGAEILRWLFVCYLTGLINLTLVPRNLARRKILCKRFSTKSRMGLESRADFGLNPLVTESHGGQNGMRAGTA